MEINIQTINKCPLNCYFCPRNWITKDQLEKIEQDKMGIGTFYMVMDECVKAGYDIFDLTPTMGELFLNHWAIDMIKHLEWRPSVKRFFFTSNFIPINDDHIDLLLKCKKLTLGISVYGHNYRTFKNNTGKKSFHIFKENMEMLFEKYGKVENSLKIEFFIRYKDWKPSALFYLLRTMESMYHNVKINYTETKHYNIGGIIPYCDSRTQHKPYFKKGVCPTAKRGYILHDGTFGLCYMNDPLKTITFDNIFEKPIKKIKKSWKYKWILWQQSRNKYTGICKNCNEDWYNYEKI